MLLSTLLEEIIPNLMLPEIEVSGLALDSREIKKGDLFFAYLGANADGRNYIASAIQQGACAILCESEGFKVSFDQSEVPIILARGVRDIVGYLAAKFYHYPSENMLVIGVTGTSGKTSTCQLISEALHKLGKKAATIGTIGYGIVGHDKVPCETTTPSPIELQKILFQFKKQGVDAVAMEVSSHALNQGRMLGMQFTLGIFTNLSRDHLDYHQTMEQYQLAKKRLFEMPGLRYGVFNCDDSTGKLFLETFKDQFHVCGYTVHENETVVVDASMVRATDIELTAEQMSAHIDSPWGSGTLKSMLLGRFNLSNLLGVLASLGLLGYSFEQIVEVLSKSKTVIGRMETFGGGDKPLFVLDYSHKPDPLEKVLIALHELCQGKLYCVFGCGGDRDRGKRPMMAKIAETYADYVILTDDNVRTEDPEQIFQDISEGFSRRETVLFEHDRKKAIDLAYSRAKAGDIILLAGKGHEDYQIIGTQKIHLSEKEIIEDLLKNKDGL